MILPGLERMNLERIRDIIAYKRHLRLALPRLQLEVARLSNFANPESYAAQFPSDAPFAYLHAAELSFAIGDVDLGIEVLAELLASNESWPRTIMQICWFAVAGAITGSLAVELRPSSFSVLPWGNQQVDGPRNSIPWPNESIAAVEVARRLLPASVATTPFEVGFAGLKQMSEGTFGKAALRALQLTAEYQAISMLWSHKVKYASSIPSLSDLEASFAERTRRALSRAEAHPTVPRGIVDFGLLCIYVGLERQNRAQFLDRRDDLPEVTFLRDLATRIASIIPPLDRGQRRDRVE